KPEGQERDASVALPPPQGEQSLARLPSWAAAGHRLQIDVEVFLRKIGLVTPLRDLRDQLALGVRERPTGVAVTKGAVADGLVDGDAGIPFRLLDQGQRLLVVLGVTGQHGSRGDQLALGVDGNRALVPIKALRRTLATVAHLWVVDRHHTIPADPLLQD